MRAHVSRSAFPRPSWRSMATISPSPRLSAARFVAFSLGAAQHGVDDAVAPARLGQLDGLRDRRVVGDAGVEQLVEADPQRRADARLAGGGYP